MRNSLKVNKENEEKSCDETEWIASFPEIGLQVSEVEKLPSFLKIAFDFFLSEEVQKKEKEIIGLFRKSPSENLFLKTYKTLKNGGDINLNDFLEIEDGIHVITKIIKTYFKKLTPSIFPEKYYNIIILSDFIEDNEKRIEYLKIFSQHFIPKNNKIIIQALFEFLIKIIENKEIYNMDVNNISIIFSPNLIKNSNKIKNVKNIKITTEIIHTYIENYHKIFDDKELNEKEQELLNIFLQQNDDNVSDSSDSEYELEDEGERDKEVDMILRNIIKHYDVKGHLKTFQTKTNYEKYSSKLKNMMKESSSAKKKRKRSVSLTTLYKKKLIQKKIQQQQELEKRILQQENIDKQEVKMRNENKLHGIEKKDKGLPKKGLINSFRNRFNSTPKKKKGKKTESRKLFGSLGKIFKVSQYSHSDIENMEKLVVESEEYDDFEDVDDSDEEGKPF